MTNRFNLPFHHIDSTAPGFQGTFDNTSTSFALQSTGLREWTGPTSRAVRIASQAGDDFHVAFGSSDLAANSSESVLVLGGTVEIFHPISPSVTHIACVSSTDVTFNATLGYGQ